MTHHIRPHKLFDLVHASVAQRIVQIKIPYRTENWLIETFLLIAALRIVNAKYVFEFGTFRGATTLNLAMNMPEGEVYTFDIDPEIAPTVEQDDLHRKIMGQHIEARVMEFEEVPHSARINRLEGNSLTFDSSPYHRSMDLVFVDGGHDLRTLAADSANAFRMAPHGCIAWHDYGNPEYPDVQKYLDSMGMPIFHVEESRLAFWFGDHDLVMRLSA
jgi:predicted O-methyltransferase YrrM